MIHPSKTQIISKWIELKRLSSSFKSTMHQKPIRMNINANNNKGLVFAVKEPNLFDNVSDFWQTILINKCSIIDLRTLEEIVIHENGYPIKSQVIDTNEKSSKNGIIIQHLFTEPSKDPITKSIYSLTDKTTGYTQQIIRIHCTTWKDGSIPSLSDFHEVVNVFKNIHDIGRSVCVHCKAGIGRTGLLLSGVYINNEILNGSDVSRINLLDNLGKKILEFRVSYDREFIEEQVQFELLCDYGIELLAQKRKGLR